MRDLTGLQFRPKCPKCGGDLGVEITDGDPGGDDKVACKSCGASLGTRNEVSAKFIADNRSEIERVAADEIVKALRKALGK